MTDNTRIIALVAETEAGPAAWSAQNRNTDGAGLAYGLLQWTQRSGSLGRLLRAMHQADPERFGQVFKDPGVVAQTTSSSEAVRMTPRLWDEPWTSRFSAAGQVAAFRQAQADLATSGPEWRAAEAIADELGVRTERSLALAFDRAVQQGPNGALRRARELRDTLTQDGPVDVAYSALLGLYAEACAAPFLRTSPPSETTTPSGKTWRRVGAEYHLFAGSVDLYQNIHRRTSTILAHPELGDDVLAA